MFIVLTKSNCVSCQKVIDFLESEGEMYKEYNLEHSTLSEENLKLLLSTKGKSLLNFIRNKAKYFSDNNINPNDLSEEDLSKIVKFNLKEVGSFPIILHLNFSGRVKNCMIGFDEAILRKWIEHQETFNCLVNANKAFGLDECCWLCKKQKLLEKIKSTPVENKKNNNDEILNNLKSLKEKNDLLIGKEPEKDLEEDKNQNQWILDKYSEARGKILNNDEKVKSSYDFFEIENKNTTFLEQLEQEKKAALEKIDTQFDSENNLNKNIQPIPYDQVEENDVVGEEIADSNNSFILSTDQEPSIDVVEPEFQIINDEPSVELLAKEVLEAPPEEIDNEIIEDIEIIEDESLNQNVDIDNHETQVILSSEDSTQNNISDSNDDFILPTLRDEVKEVVETKPIQEETQDLNHDREQDYKFTDKEEYVEEIDINEYIHEPKVFEEESEVLENTDSTENKEVIDSIAVSPNTQNTSDSLTNDEEFVIITQDDESTNENGNDNLKNEDEITVSPTEDIHNNSTPLDEEENFIIIDHDEPEEVNSIDNSAIDDDEFIPVHSIAPNNIPTDNSNADYIVPNTEDNQTETIHDEIIVDSPVTEEDSFITIDFDDEEPSPVSEINEVIDLNKRQNFSPTQRSSSTIDEYDQWIERYRLNDSELNHQKAIENEK